MDYSFNLLIPNISEWQNLVFDHVVSDGSLVIEATIWLVLLALPLKKIELEDTVTKITYILAMTGAAAVLIVADRFGMLISPQSTNSLSPLDVRSRNNYPIIIAGASLLAFGRCLLAEKSRSQAIFTAHQNDSLAKDVAKLNVFANEET